MMILRGTILCWVLTILSLPTYAGDGRILQNTDIEQLPSALTSGRLTSEELVRYYVDRIARFDKAGPHINAMISLNPAVLEDARRLDAEARSYPISKGSFFKWPLPGKTAYLAYRHRRLAARRRFIPGTSYCYL